MEALIQPSNQLIDKLSKLLKLKENSVLRQEMPQEPEI